MGRKCASILCVAALVLLLLPLDATAATPSGPSHKVVVDSKDTGTLQQLAQGGATLLADYGSFSLWRTSDTQRQAIAARPSVATRDDFDIVHLRGGRSIDTVAGAPPVAASAQQNRSSGPQFWMVQFVGPIKPEWLARLRQSGIEIVAYMPNNTYVVWLDGGQLTQLESQAQADPTIQWTGPYHPAYRIAPPLQAASVAQAAQPVTVTVQLYNTTGVQTSVAGLRGLGGAVVRDQENVLNLVNISLDVPGIQVAAIAARADVFNIEPYATPTKRDEAQGQIVAGNVTTSGANVVPTAPGYRQWLLDHGFPTTPGRYPVIDVVDDGIDNGTANPLHPDFHEQGVIGNPSRLVFNSNCTADPKGDGQAGHGNLNAGIVAGYNDRTVAPYVDGSGYDLGLGISPFGRVAGTKIFRNPGAPVSFDESACGNTDAGTVLSAANAGATITSNSWGSTVFGQYDSSAQAYDALTRNARLAGTGNQQMLHVFSAGNDGGGAQTIGSPGTAKNVLTVGATENVRDNTVVDGCGLTAAGSANNIASFSSRGPTTDGRIKPDIVAPGTHVQGPASQDPTYDGSGVCGAAGPNPRYYPVSGQTLYTWSSGTSHSAPAVAGVASLVYNYYGRVVNPGQTPSPAMLKALILNAPRYLTGTGASDALPSPNQGWGDANLGAIFDTTRRFVVDQTRTFTNTGETYVTGGSVADTSQPLRVTLVWTDAPGSTTGIASVNNLDLEVTVGGNTYKGNVFSGSFSAPGGTADALNNVESVFLPPGASGSFTVKVTAANLAGQGVNASTPTNQDFALVIANDTIAPPPTVSSINPSSGDKAGGTPVTIKGTNFGGPTTVAFDSFAATRVTVVDSTTITAVTPAHAPGSATVTVTTNAATLTLATPFTYGTVNALPPPQQPGTVAPGTPNPAPGSRPAAPVPSGGSPLPNPLPPRR